jgi:uncharacterized protein YcsI (UPF0317 family)
MNGRLEPQNSIATASWERISYIKHMLGELSHVARAERADLLVYLIEMAFTEAGDLADARMSSRHIERHKAARMAVKPAGKI